MALTEADVKKIAHLARINIAADAIPTYYNDLAKIIGLVDQISSVDTTDVPPMAHPLNMTQRLRPDMVNEQDQRQQLQEIAPETESGLYLVPQVIE